jgi:RHS repeat-associated protein
MRRRLWVALLVSIPLLVLGLPAPRVAAITQPNQITYVYDELGRLEAAIAKYTYDARGNLLSIARQSTAATSIVDFHPKSAKQDMSVTIYGAAFSATPSQNTVRFGGSNGSQATVTSASTTQLVVTVPAGAPSGPIYVSSPLGSATSAQQFALDASTAPSITGFTPTMADWDATPAPTVTITGTGFDPSSPKANDVFINGITYGYNNAGQVTSLTQGSTVVSLDYFADGRLQTLTLKPSPTPVTQGYSYDDAGELSQISYTHGATSDDLSYGYDPSGRRTAVWGTYGRVTLPAATTSNAVYDVGNRLTSWNGAAVVHDNNGNLTSDGTFTYTYNPRNQLTLVKQGNQTRGSYTYDGVGRRVVRTIGNSTTKPAYDGWNLVQERASNGNSVVANYLTGLGLDQPFVRTAGSSTSYYLSDALASTTGTVPTSYTYEPYGKTTVSGTASASFFGFTGRENDSTGTLSLYNYRARAYSPTLHRFLSEDPIGVPGSLQPNEYSYASDSPTSFVDPMGLEDRSGSSQWLDWVIGIAFVGAVVCLATTACALGLISLIGSVPYVGPTIALVLLGAGTFGTSAGSAVQNQSPSRITSYSDEAIGRVILRDGHGVSPQAILNALRTQIVDPIWQPETATWLLKGKDASIVVNSAGRLVTAWATNSAGWRY